LEDQALEKSEDRKIKDRKMKTDLTTKDTKLTKEKVGEKRNEPQMNTMPARRDR
jgi:hypothetical protein